MATTKVRDGRLRQHKRDDPPEDTTTPLRSGEAVMCTPRITLPGEPPGRPAWRCWDSQGRYVVGVPDQVAERLHARLSTPVPEDRANAKY